MHPVLWQEIVHKGYSEDLYSMVLPTKISHCIVQVPKKWTVTAPLFFTYSIQRYVKVKVGQELYKQRRGNLNDTHMMVTTLCIKGTIRQLRRERITTLFHESAFVRTSSALKPYEYKTQRRAEAALNTVCTYIDY